MYRSNFLFLTGVVTLGLVALWFVTPSASQNESELSGPANLKIRNITRRRRTRKPPLRQLRPYARVHAVAHLPRHAPCIERF